MINLNFTSPSQNAINQFHKNYRLVKSLVVFTVIALLFIVASLYISQIILQNKLEKVTAETLILKEQTENENSLNLGLTVQNFNTLIGNVAGIQSEYAKWSYILLETAESVTDGVVLESFDVQKSNSTFQFSGTAVTRDSLLSFKNNLEASPFFDNIESPISNLLSKEDISFTLSGKVVLDPKIEEIK